MCLVTEGAFTTVCLHPSHPLSLMMAEIEIFSLYITEEYQ